MRNTIEKEKLNVDYTTFSIIWEDRIKREKKKTFVYFEKKKMARRNLTRGSFRPFTNLLQIARVFCLLGDKEEK